MLDAEKRVELYRVERMLADELRARKGYLDNGQESLAASAQRSIDELEAKKAKLEAEKATIEDELREGESLP